MDSEWTNEGMVMNSWTFGLFRQIWQATGKDRAFGGGFSILQAKDSPDRLVIEAQEEYGQELSRSEVERLVRNLQEWLETGDSTCPHDGDESLLPVPEGYSDEELDRMALEMIRKAAEECDVEKVVLRTDNDEKKISWSLFVLWGRETVYTDTMRFLDLCGWAGDHAYFYFSEEAREIRKYRDSVFETVYEKRGDSRSARRPSGIPFFQDPETPLGQPYPLLGGQAVPSRRFRIGLRDAPALLVHLAEVALGSRIALPCGLPAPFGGLPV